MKVKFVFCHMYPRDLWIELHIILLFLGVLYGQVIIDASVIIQVQKLQFGNGHLTLLAELM